MALLKYFACLKADADTAHPTCHTKDERSCISGRYRWVQVEKDYRQEMEDTHQPQASHALFTRIRKNAFPELTLQKKTKMLPECSICTRLSTLAKEYGVPGEVATAARYVRALHRSAVAANRKALAELDGFCTRPLASWVSFRADGSDWKRPFPVAPTNIRHPALEASLISCRLQFRDYDRKSIYVYFPDVWKTKAVGCDFWITCMMLELALLFEQHPDARPEVLALHADNTVRICCVRRGYSHALV